MLNVPMSLRVFAKTTPTDMRKSFDGLAGLVEQELGQQVESGHLFLFFNRRRDRVKVLWFVGDGLVIWYKRLEGGTFEVPRAKLAMHDDGSVSPAATIEMRTSELTLILDGIELSSVRRRRRWRRA
jgi:transposase